MKWLRCREGDTETWAILDGEHALPVDGSPFDGHVATGRRLPVSTLDWLPPVRPSKILALWNNFGAAAAKNGWTRPAEPLWFLKAASSLAGPGDAIPAPPEGTGRVAYEGELAIVIGRRARRIDVADAAAHVLGYSCANDVTAIELLNRDASFAQWSRAKGFDGFGVIGPVIETEFDPAAASVRTTVDGRERQNYPLADMFVPPLELVARLSHDVTLEPGDVILCGTSVGVLPMKPGAKVEVSIDGIGTLSNVYAPGA
ncbi:MAG: fumarylacetoacetate hydrolase family protein [Burkholderiales bacterium]|jgi:2-keto-4-pentenoate hydratase/2-oxohepta-3-ene-1,7-dioic acid hydratase in catechol pathway